MFLYIRAIDWKVLFGVMLFWYIAPVLGASEFMRWILDASNHGEADSPSLLHNILVSIVLVWWLLAPIGSAYSIARFAKQLPHLGVLLVVTVGFVLQATHNDYFGWIGIAVLAILSIAGAMLGLFLWRLRMRNRS
jgi:hypothetical protein